MNIDSIQQGIVLDHIKAGKSMEIYKYLQLDKLNCSVAIIKNVKSKKLGCKDIIKIDESIEVNLDVLGYIDPNITISTIRDGKTVEKRHLALPQYIVNVKKCKNPRCITSIERDLDHTFKLVDKENRVYRCIYCEAE